METDIKILTSIKGVGTWKARLIIAYCGSVHEAVKSNSLLFRGKIPGIGNKSKAIFNQLKNVTK